MAWAGAITPIVLSQILNMTLVSSCVSTYLVEACHLLTRQVAAPRVHRKGGTNSLLNSQKHSFLHAEDLTRPGPRARRICCSICFVVVKTKINTNDKQPQLSRTHRTMTCCLLGSTPAILPFVCAGACPGNLAGACPGNSACAGALPRQPCWRWG